MIRHVKVNYSALHILELFKIFLLMFEYESEVSEIYNKTQIDCFGLLNLICVDKWENLQRIDLADILSFSSHDKKNNVQIFDFSLFKKSFSFQSIMSCFPNYMSCFQSIICLVFPKF